MGPVDFLDTGYAIALLSTRDRYHAVAKRLNADLKESAYRLFKQRPDKDWSLTDCVSFVLMGERGISEALTADQHFVQAEIEALLLPV